MNKREAEAYAAELIVDAIEALLTGEQPRVYHWMFPEKLQGLRLSERDEERLEDALCAVQDRVDKRGWKDLIDARRMPQHADGKPGARWKGYKPT